MREKTSDYKELKRLLDKFGIGYKENETKDDRVLSIEEGMKKVLGYAGFYADFYFDESDSFVKVSIGE